MAPGDTVEHLYHIRTGAIETRDPDDQLLARLGEGDFCGVRSILGGGTAVNRSEAIEDCLVYLLPVEAFNDLRAEPLRRSTTSSPPWPEGASAPPRALDNGGRQIDLLSIRVADMLVRDPITIAPTATIGEAAVRMRDERVSCLLVTEDEKLQRHLHRPGPAQPGRRRGRRL